MLLYLAAGRGPEREMTFVVEGEEPFYWTALKPVTCYGYPADPRYGLEAPPLVRFRVDGEGGWLEACDFELDRRPLDRRFLQPAPKGLGDPKGEVELVPDAWTVFEQIAPIYMHGMIFGAMTESFCAEQSARMTAMDSATKSANDMIRDLQLEYNRTRQGSITQEITEIIGGAAAVQDRT